MYLIYIYIVLCMFSRVIGVSLNNKSWKKISPAFNTTNPITTVLVHHLYLKKNSQILVAELLLSTGSVSYCSYHLIFCLFLALYYLLGIVM